MKFNGGHGALLCNNCHIILSKGFEHEDREHLCRWCTEAKQTAHNEKVLKTWIFLDILKLSVVLLVVLLVIGRIYGLYESSPTGPEANHNTSTPSQ